MRKSRVAARMGVLAAIGNASKRAVNGLLIRQTVAFETILRSWRMSGRDWILADLEKWSWRYGIWPRQGNLLWVLFEGGIGQIRHYNTSEPNLGSSAAKQLSFDSGR
jgi:hypothetical protein